MKVTWKTTRSFFSLASLRNQVQLQGLRDGQLDQKTVIEGILRAELAPFAKLEFPGTECSPEALEIEESKTQEAIDDFQRRIEDQQLARDETAPLVPPKVSVWRWGSGIISLGGLWMLYASLSDPQVLNLTYLGILATTCVAVLSLLPFMVSIPGRLARGFKILGHQMTGQYLRWQLAMATKRLARLNSRVAKMQKQIRRQTEWTQLQLLGLLGHYESYRTTGARLMRENTVSKPSIMEARS